MLRNRRSSQLLWTRAERACWWQRIIVCLHSARASIGFAAAATPVAFSIRRCCRPRPTLDPPLLPLPLGSVGSTANVSTTTVDALSFSIAAATPIALSRSIAVASADTLSSSIIAATPVVLSRSNPAATSTNPSLPPPLPTHHCHHLFCVWKKFPS